MEKYKKEALEKIDNLLKQISKLKADALRIAKDAGVPFVQHSEAGAACFVPPKMLNDLEKLNNAQQDEFCADLEEHGIYLTAGYIEQGWQSSYC